jgi:polyisoprenyl-phosphate glycosyltransferase
MISVVIPVFNGEKSLVELFSKIRNELKGYSDFEVLFIHDNGNEKSLDTIKYLKGTDPERVQAFHFNKNSGQHFATLFGIKKAHGDYIFTIDEDLQHDPNYFISMLKKAKGDNLDLLYGRFEKIEQPVSRVILSNILRMKLCLLIPNLPSKYSSYRLISKTLADRICNTNSPVVFLDAEFGELSKNHDSILVKHLKREGGNSSYSSKRLFRQTIDVLFKYSKRFRILFLGLQIILILGLIWTSTDFAKNQHINITSTIILFGILIFLIITRNNSLSRLKRVKTNLKIEQIS